jgi:hypothetical protein
MQQALQCTSCWLQCCAFGAVGYGADLNFAPFDVLGNQLSQGWFELTQLIRQAKTQVQKTAVDRSDFQS